MADLLGTMGTQRLNIGQRHPHHLLVKENQGIKSLILGAGGDFILDQLREKPFQFLLASSDAPEVRECSRNIA